MYSAGHLPIVGRLVVDAQTRRFNAAGGQARLFNGIYPDFAAAQRAIPAGRESGYDNRPSASRVIDEWLMVYPSDYPVLFWLSQLLPSAAVVFDWGGNVGLKYFAYRKFLSYPAALRWCVSDVAAVVDAGEQIARREAATALCFSTNLDELPNADILLAAGAIHFIEQPLQMLRAAGSLPQHLLLNKVPVYDVRPAVTLQNMGTAFCPNHLFNRSELVKSFIELGYRLVDDWISPELGCEIPFHSEYSIKAYSGFYFTKSAKLPVREPESKIDAAADSSLETILPV